MKKTIISTLLAFISVIITVFLSNYDYINLILYAALTLFVTDTNQKMWKNWLVLYLPFFIVQSIPTIIQIHFNPLFLKNIFVLSEIVFITNVLLPLLIYGLLYFKYYKIRGFLVVLSVVVSIIPGFFNRELQILMVGTIYLVLGLFLPFNNSETTLKKFLFIYLPYFFIFTFSILWEPISTGIPFDFPRLIVLPINLLAPIALFIGLKMQNLSPDRKFVYSFFLVALFAFASFIGYTNWLSVIYKTENIKNLPNLTFVTEQNEVIEIDKNKLTIIDVWTSSCGVCFKQFPDYQKLEEAYKKNTSVQFYSVNIPSKRDDRNKLIEQIRKKYRFPIFFGNDEFRNLFQIDAYPHLIVIQNNEVKYSGFVSYKKTDYYSINNIITRLNK